MRRGSSLTSQTAFGGQLPYEGSLVRPAVRFEHSLFEYDGRFLRATNHEQRATAFFSESNAAFRRDRFIIVLRPCAVCHKFRLCTGFTRPFWPVRCRPAEGARRLPKRTAEAGRLGQASPTQSQTGDKNLCGDKPHSKAPYGAFFYEPRVIRGERRTAACDRRAVRLLYMIIILF